MGNMWLKIKIWTKGIIFGALLLYALVFLVMNMGQVPVTLWFWYNTKLQISPLLLVFMTFLIGVIAAVLMRTTLTTIRQIREARDRSRTERLEREVADMKSKAAMLKTRSAAGSDHADFTGEG
jgi:uncharacterized integral membrane protein